MVRVGAARGRGRSEVRVSYLQFSVTDRDDTATAGARLLDLEPGLSVPEIARLARAFARSGITRVRLAGGEPLLRDEVIAIVETFARQPGISVLAMTTDGVHLARYAEPLLWAGLQRLTITLDTLDRDTYRRLAGHDSLPQVLAGLEAACRLPFQQVCVSAVIRRGLNDGELPAFVALARDTAVTVRLSETSPRDESDTEWVAQFVPAADLRARLADLGLTFETRADVARAHLPGGGVVEVVAAVSDRALRPWLHLQVDNFGRLTSVKTRPTEDLRPWIASPDLEEHVREAVRRAET